MQLTTFFSPEDSYAKSIIYLHLVARMPQEWEFHYSEKYTEVSGF